MGGFQLLRAGSNPASCTKMVYEKRYIYGRPIYMEVGDKIMPEEMDEYCKDCPHATTCTPVDLDELDKEEASEAQTG